MFNPYILVPLAVWAIAQLTKFIVSAAEGKLDFKALYASGGMPSVHGAVVCSLATTSFLLDGPNSHIFGFTAIFAAIVMYDSLGVRRSSGEQGVALNMVIQSLTRHRVQLVNPDVKLKEVLGHKPSEVLVGALYGIFLGMLLNLNHLGNLITFLSNVPSKIEVLVYFGLAIVLLIGGVLAGVLLRRRKSAVFTTFGNRLMYDGIIGAVVVAALAFSEYEKAVYVDYRLWMLVAIVAVVAYKLVILNWAMKEVPAARTIEANAERVAKWLPKPKKKSKKRA